MHLEDIFESVGKYTWRPSSIEIAGVLAGG